MKNMGWSSKISCYFKLPIRGTNEQVKEQLVCLKDEFGNVLIDRNLKIWDGYTDEYKESELSEDDIFALIIGEITDDIENDREKKWCGNRFKLYWEFNAYSYKGESTEEEFSPPYGTIKRISDFFMEKFKIEPIYLLPQFYIKMHTD